MRYNDTKLIIFSKAPDPGKTKTRLIPALGEANAAELQQRMATHIIQSMHEADLCDLEIQGHPNCQHPFFLNLLNDYCIELNAQQGRDLGERMAHALVNNLNHYKKVIIIGSDIPAINSNYIKAAIEQLEKGSDVVIGPAEDGGYVLLGASRFEPAIVKNIHWGTKSVLANTLDQAKQLNYSVAMLTPLWDVDLPEDLERLKADETISHLASGLPPN